MYNLKLFTANNSVGSQASQSFTLTVGTPPAITSATSVSYVGGIGGNFTVTDTGSPTPILAETVMLPSGVTFTPATGVLAVGTTAANGVYNLAFTANNSVGSQASQSFTLTVGTPPAITSATSVSYFGGTGGNFTVTDTGSPTPTLAETATLPSGVTFTPATGVLAVSTTAATGVYPLTFTANNGVGSQASQSFTLTVGTPPAITSANNASFVFGTGGNFTVTVTGSPTPTLAETATLPSGATFTPTTGVLAVSTTAATGVYNLTFTANNGVGGQASQSFTLTVSAPVAITNHFAITGTPTAPVAAGTSFSFTVTAEDASDNTVSGYAGTVQITSTDGHAVLPANATLSNGTGTFAITLATAANQTIEATDTVNESITGTSGNITVTPAAASQLVVMTQPSATATAGVAFGTQPVVAEEDRFGNVITGDSMHTLTAASTGTAALQGTATVSLIDGVAIFSCLAYDKAETIDLSFSTNAGAFTATSGNIVVSPAAASQFLVSAPAVVTANTAFSFTVTAVDSFDNTVVSYGGTAHFSSSDAGALLPANATLTSGTGSFSATLKTSGDQTLTATDTVNSAITGASNPIDVAGDATHFAVSAPADATAGTAFSFTVTALDFFNLPASTYTGVIHFSSNDPLANVPINVALSDGVGTFTATLKTAGDQNLTVADAIDSSVSGAATIDVAPLAATHLAVNVPPSATAGTPFMATVIAQDIYNNTATSFQSAVYLGSTDGQAVLPANSVLSDGVGAFSITLETAGNQTLTATDTVNSSINGTSGNVNVRAVTATHYLVSAPSSVTAGTPFTFTVTALDAFNNLVSGYAGTVHFTSGDAQSVLPGDANLTDGVGTFSATMKTAGSQTLTAADAANSSITGTDANLSVSAAAVAHFAFNPVASAIAGTAFDFTLTAEDSFNNTVGGYTGMVHFTSSDAQSVLPANATLTNGVGTFSAHAKDRGRANLDGH